MTHLGISHRARQNRRVSRGVVGQGDLVVDLVTDLARRITGLGQVDRGLEQVRAPGRLIGVDVREPGR